MPRVEPCVLCGGRGRGEYLAAPAKLAPCPRCRGNGCEPAKVAAGRWVAWGRCRSLGVPEDRPGDYWCELSKAMLSQSKALKAGRLQAAMFGEAWDGGLVALPEGVDPVV